MPVVAGTGFRNYYYSPHNWGGQRDDAIVTRGDCFNCWATLADARPPVRKPSHAVLLVEARDGRCHYLPKPTMIASLTGNRYLFVLVARPMPLQFRLMVDPVYSPFSV